MFKNLASQVGYQIIGRVVIAALGVFVTAFLSRYLGVYDFGTFNFLLTVAYFSFLFADYGLQTLIVRDIASREDISKAVGTFLSARLLLSIGVMVALGIASVFLPYSSNVKHALIVIGIAEFLNILNGVFHGVFQGQVAFGRLTLIMILTSITQAIFMLFGIFLKAPFLFFAYAHTITVLISTFMSWTVAKSLIGHSIEYNFQLSSLKTTLRRGFPFAIGLLVSVAYFRADTLILGYYFDPQKFPDVGLYSLAYKPFEVVVVVGGYMAQTLYPLFVPLISTKILLNANKKYVLYSLGMALGAAMFLYFGAPYFVMLLGGAAYSLSVVPIQILAVAASVTILSGYFGALALAGGKEKKLMVYGACALVVNIILNVLWVPKYSYIATSWATVITQSVIMIGNAYAAWEVLEKHHD